MSSNSNSSDTPASSEQRSSVDRGSSLTNALNILQRTQRQSLGPNTTPRTLARGSGDGTPTPSTSGESSGAKLPLKIRTLDGKTHNIPEARTNWTVKQLKEAFAYWQGQGWENVGLFYKAKRLNDAERLSTYNIEPDAVIHANYRSKGGIRCRRG